METLWFCLVAAMIVAYVVLDGFDLGVGIILLAVARTEPERRLVLRTIGPFWGGNEVWLLAAGGTLFFAFPTLYASSFSGFYLPLMIVLWLLILRGIAIEFRSHIDSPIWKPLWDVVFSVSSTLLAIFFGVALGNVVRGVPLDASGFFFEPLWTDFRPGPRTGIIDWYTTLVGVLAFAILLTHGARWVALRTDGRLRDRARRAARRAWWAVALLTVLVTLATFRVQPHVPARLREHLLGFLFPTLAVVGLIAMRAARGRNADRGAFAGSCAYLTGMLASAAFGVYPFVLPAITDPSFALTVQSAAAARHGLSVGLMWWVLGMMLVAVYFVFTYRAFSGKVRLEGEGH